MRSTLAGILLILVLNPAVAEPGLTFSGKASWYQCCSHTANGEKFRPDGLTAAHRTLPFGSKVLVQNMESGKKVIVSINDRGPFSKGRVIDLSRGAAREIGLIGSGVANVKATVLGAGLY